MAVFPLDNNAAAQARCMELLEAGAWMIPFKGDGLIVTFIYLPLYHFNKTFELNINYIGFISPFPFRLF